MRRALKVVPERGWSGFGVLSRLLSAIAWLKHTILVRATISAATFRAVSLRNLPRAEAWAMFLTRFAASPTDTYGGSPTKAGRERPAPKAPLRGYRGASGDTANIGIQKPFLFVKD